VVWNDWANSTNLRGFKNPPRGFSTGDALRGLPSSFAILFLRGPFVFFESKKIFWVIFLADLIGELEWR